MKTKMKASAKLLALFGAASLLLAAVTLVALALG